MPEIKLVSGETVKDIRLSVFASEQGYPEDKVFDDKENSKGQSGCRYNRKTLDKKYNEKMDEIYKEESEWYLTHCINLFNGS